MANVLEMGLHRELRHRCRHNKISKFIEQSVDCNWTRFDFKTFTFLSPIQIAAKSGNTSVLCLLYEKRNYPTEKHLQEHFNFYSNHYCSLKEDYNASLLEYTVNSLLHMDVMSYSVKDYDILIAALNDYDDVVQRGEKLSIGSHPKMFLLLRIFSLTRRILQMDVECLRKLNKKELAIMKKELLHNLEIYYLIQDIDSIPIHNVTEEIMKQSFDKMEVPYKGLFTKHYEHIAKNVIKKIKELQINEEYTIPSGWHDHSICVSFRLIKESHVHVRIDNPSSTNPFSVNETDRPINHYRRIKSEILGQLSLSNLDDNLNYFVLLMDSIIRDIPMEDGWSLIYNTKQIIHQLEKAHDEEIPEFLEQASSNCFLKCFEPGFRVRLGQKHEKLCERLLAFEKETAQWLKTRCEQKYERNPTGYYIRFSRLANQNKKDPLMIEGKSHLQDKLKASYKQKYQYLPSFIIGENSNSSMEKYVPLKFKSNNVQITLPNLLIKPRVLVLADPGCGKTTICEYITYSWSSNKLWKNKFKWLFYIRIRNLNSTFHLHRRQNNNYLILDIIEKECFQGYKLSMLDKKRLMIQLENPSNILWILDGLDERGVIPDYLESIVSELLAKPNILLTSRPYVTDNLQWDMKVEIERFTNEDIKDFVRKYFMEMPEEKATECYSFIQSSQQFQETAQAPACLVIICNLWQNRTEKLDFILSTEELYRRMCEYLLQRYLIKFHRIKKSALAGIDVFQEPGAIGFVHLEYLAFRATASCQLTISSEEIRTITKGLLFSIVDIGLLIFDRKSLFSSFVEDSYTFIHRTFQEYLCCRYMIRILISSSSFIEQKDEVLQFIANQKYNLGVRDTFRLFFRMEDAKYCSDQFWSAVDSEPLDLVGLRHCPRIWEWFPSGSYENPSEQNNIDKRTIDTVTTWISNKARRAHDFGNTYLFEWFYKAIPHYWWWTAWKEDLLIEDSSLRRYFLSDLWSSQNIATLRNIYDIIPEEKVEALHRLIKKGPTIVTLEDLQLDPNVFVLQKIDDQTEARKILAGALTKVRKRQEINDLTEFRTLLENYQLFTELNRQIALRGKEIWPLEIAASALISADKDTLELLLQLIEKNLLFYRNFVLPITPFLELYVTSNTSNEDTLCSLIVSIAFSSTYTLTALPDEKKFIRVFEKEKFRNIELSENRWDKLIKAFKCARDAYGYSGLFFKQ